jgi:hypothetical protein
LIGGWEFGREMEKVVVFFEFGITVARSWVKGLLRLQTLKGFCEVEVAPEDGVVIRSSFTGWN